MPTLSGQAGACAMADTCAAETELMPSPVLSVASVTGEAEVASREELTFSAYVIVYGCTVVSNHNPT